MQAVGGFGFGHTQPERADRTAFYLYNRPYQDKGNKELLRKVVEDYKVGGLLFSGGLMQNQAMLTNEAQRMADIPLLITFDGEWGLSMRLRGTPVFPKNMVLGCIQNDTLLYEYGRKWQGSAGNLVYR